MELKLDEPIGHANRKLRGYVAEIARLKREGYTVPQIHRALTAAGVVVGIASVYREVQRAQKKALAERTAPPSPVATAPQPATGTAPPGTAGEGSKSTGKTKTDEFFDSYTPPNPILERLDRLRNKKP